MKTLLYKLLMSSLFLWTISCGQIELSSVDGIQPLSKITQVEKNTEKLINSHKLLNTELARSYSKVISKVSDAANPFTLARLILDNESGLDELFDWADKLLDNLEKVNSPLVNSRADEIRELRDSESDPELRERYDAILERLEEEHSVTRINVSYLQRKVRKGILNLNKAQDWMFRSFWSTVFFITFGSNIQDKIIDLEVTLNYLDVNLERMDQD
ncbi:MAG: hypothetical protein HAW60_03945 [Bdellovibrionales bacterium]|nr:hypothetical protein [Bdellovibrionales bacterium]